MDKVWTLKFTCMVAGAPLGAFQLFFGDKEKAQKTFDDYQKYLSRKPSEEGEPFVVEDMVGQYAFRPDFYPFCSMIEVSEFEVLWKEIDDSLKRFREQAGREVKVGFMKEIK